MLEAQEVKDLKALVLNCTLTPSPESSSTELLARQLLGDLQSHAELSETDGQGRMTTYDKVGLVAVVGNEDGAHHVSAEVYQALNDTGFSLAPNAVTYWVGRAMQGTDCKDPDQTPDETANTTQVAARNAAHLAKLLRSAPYPVG